MSNEPSSQGTRTWAVVLAAGSACIGGLVFPPVLTLLATGGVRAMTRTFEDGGLATAGVTALLALVLGVLFVFVPSRSIPSAAVAPIVLAPWGLGSLLALVATLGLGDVSSEDPSIRATRVASAVASFLQNHFFGGLGTAGLALAVAGAYGWASLGERGERKVGPGVALGLGGWAALLVIVGLGGVAGVASGRVVATAALPLLLVIGSALVPLVAAGIGGALDRRRPAELSASSALFIALAGLACVPAASARGVMQVFEAVAYVEPGTRAGLVQVGVEEALVGAAIVSVLALVPWLLAAGFAFRAQRTGTLARASYVSGGLVAATVALAVVVHVATSFVASALASGVDVGGTALGSLFVP